MNLAESAESAGAAESAESAGAASSLVFSFWSIAATNAATPFGSEAGGGGAPAKQAAGHSRRVDISLTMPQWCGFPSTNVSRSIELCCCVPSANEQHLIFCRILQCSSRANLSRQQHIWTHQVQWWHPRRSYTNTNVNHEVENWTQNANMRTAGGTSPGQAAMCRHHCRKFRMNSYGVRHRSRPSRKSSHLDQPLHSIRFAENPYRSGSPICFARRQVSLHSDKLATMTHNKW
eukprot:SAG31_NODE_1284_length_9010_cov_56.116934_5_plen_233_part_00